MSHAVNHLRLAYGLSLPGAIARFGAIIILTIILSVAVSVVSRVTGLSLLWEAAPDSDPYYSSFKLVEPEGAKP